MNNMSKKLGKRIQELRKLKGLTQSQLAEKLDVEVVSVTRIEGGTRFPKRDNLEKIAEILDVEVRDLFDYEHEKTKTVLSKEIKEMLKNAQLEDLKYIYRLLKFHFENK